MEHFWAFARDGLPYTRSQFHAFYGAAGEEIWLEALHRMLTKWPPRSPPESSVDAVKCIPLVSWEELFAIHCKRLESLDAVGTDIGWATLSVLRSTKRRVRSTPAPRGMPTAYRLINRRLIQDRKKLVPPTVDLNALD